MPCLDNLLSVFCVLEVSGRDILEPNLVLKPKLALDRKVPEKQILPGLTEYEVIEVATKR